MQINLKDIKLYCGSLEGDRPPVRPIFDEQICSFWEETSRLLLHDKAVRAYPDVTTFAFFCRRGNIKRLSEQYKNQGNRLGRGVSFHIAPSNVPINFAYTLVMGLLAGNSCIVKASSKDFVQTRLVTEAMNRVLMQEAYASLRPYVTVVSYPRERQDMTEALSEDCNLRIIWGGDQTIQAVRRAPLPPRALELTFADRYSLAVLDATAVLKADLPQLAQDFYNDTYLYDQNACSSPRLIYWLGKREIVTKAQAVFWQAIWENIRERYPVEPVVAVDKLLAVCRTGIEMPGSKHEAMRDNRIVRVEVPEMTEKLPNWRAAGGLFHEYVSENLEDLTVLADEHCQTVAYYGLQPEVIQDFVCERGLYGVDRIVPVGRTSEMGVIWDGQDFISSMSRMVALS